MARADVESSRTAEARSADVVPLSDDLPTAGILQPSAPASNGAGVIVPNPSPSDSARSSTTPPGEVVAPEPEPSADLAAVDQEGLDTVDDRAPVFAGLVALTIVGGYLFRARGRRRDTALRHRHPGRLPQPPKRGTRRIARRLSASAQPGYPEFVNVGLRALAGQLQGTAPQYLPRITGVWVSHNKLVVALAESVDVPIPPPPFRPFAGGSGWTLHRADFEEAAEIARGVNGPLPLLTTMGSTSALDLALATNSRAPADAYGLSTTLLYAVDLEAARVVSIRSANEATAVEALTMMALELATSETADQVEIICVGFGHRLATFDRVMVVDQLDEILDDLETVASRAVYAEADANPFATRVGNGAADTWNPVVVFHPDGPARDRDTLVELAAMTDGGVTAVCGYPADVGWTFDVVGNRVSCPQFPGGLANHQFIRPELDGVELVPELFDEPWGDVAIDDEFWEPRPLEPPDPTWQAWPEDDSMWEPMSTLHREPGDEHDSAVAVHEPVLAQLRHSVEHRPTEEPVADQTTADRPSRTVPPEPIRDEPADQPADPPSSADDPTSATEDHLVGGRHLFVVPDEQDETNRSDDAVAVEDSTTSPVEVEVEVEVESSVEAQPEEVSDPVEPDQSVEEQLRISVLGAFTIDGRHIGDRDKPWKYSKTPELLLYLLLHPSGASQDLLMEQLFPDQPPNRPRLNQLVSDARTKALGKDRHGDYHLPHASPTEPFYKLLPTVSLDLRDFAHLCAAARKADTVAEEIEAWREALTLVTGRPFALPNDGYEWALPEIEATIVKVEEAAMRLADLAIDDGDYELAVWATKQGLLTGTGYYELLAKRGRAALLLQDPVEIVRAFADLQLSLQHTGAPEEGAPDLSVHPELQAVYEELSEGRGKDRP